MLAGKMIKQHQQLQTPLSKHGAADTHEMVAGLFMRDANPKVEAERATEVPNQHSVHHFFHRFQRLHVVYNIGFGHVITLRTHLSGEIIAY